MEVAKSLKSEAGQLYALKCDIGNESDIQEAFSWVKTNLGGVDILVNNAGCSFNNTLRDGPEETWRQIFDLNVLGLSICTKEALKIMKEKGVDDGHIIHINSFLGHIVPPPERGLTMYSAAKHAVTALTEGLRRELVNSKSKIRVTEAAKSLKSEPGQLYALKCDVKNESDIKEAFSWVKNNLGGVDVLVNNVGGTENNTLIDGPVDCWRGFFDLDVIGLSICTKEAIQIMRDNGVDDGHIIHINSLLGHTIPPVELGLNMYSAAKHAVTALTEGLRRELVNAKSKIKVSSLSPALVNTTAASQRYLKVLPHLEPKDVADAAVYILGTPPHVQIHELTLRAVGSV
ncbi:dehydrogenase/reductase SDR family member 11-like isoform X2 [Periplaneta americana]|uniref:dehydrogenase/reductase SDR family member 11-like isoform X2 n=1 Tax=Periplaneta americana TaxID=6978 RepID=UPI0037E92DCD